jgi:hypothetical protein
MDILMKRYLFPALMALGLLIPAFAQTTVFNCSTFASTGDCGVGVSQKFVKNGWANVSAPNITFIPAGVTHVNAALWWYTPVNIQQFTSSFTFAPDGQNFAFVVQNNIGTSGNGTAFDAGAGCESGFYQAFGAGPPPNHLLALELDSYSPLTENGSFTYSSTQIYHALQSPCLPNDNGPGYTPITKLSTYPVNLTTGSRDTTTGHTYSATVKYDGNNLTIDMYDVTAGGECPGAACYSHTWSDVDIPSLVGNRTAYVGFTGATGLVSLHPLHVDSFSYTEGSTTQVAIPTFSPAAGTYPSARSVSISDVASNTAIYYTTNGAAPTTSSTRYTGPITVSSTETLKAMAVTSGKADSAVASAAYTITSLPSIATPDFSPAAGTYTSAQSVTISDATGDAAIYYTTNGTAPTTSSNRYAGPITVSSTETLKAIGVVPDGTNSALASAAYTINSPSVAQVAYVYDTVTAGTYAYEASSSGRLTIIEGSPFRTSGSLVGTNGKFLITRGSGHVYAYEVESNGGIGKLISKINTQLYSGSECGSSPQEAELDRTGAYVYALLGGKYSTDKKACSAIQTFEIGNTGELNFKGSTNAGDENTVLPSVTGNNKFAYSLSSTEGHGGDCCHFTNFSRESTGVLNVISAHEANPEPKPGKAGYSPVSNPTPDPTDHFALTVEPQGGGLRQLASYTVDSQGNTTSNNTWENMPKVADEVYGMALDPTGRILAVATGNGVQFFRFNGANPVTPFTMVIGDSGSITKMAWDDDRHLYAQNGASGAMHVYEVTTKSVEELSGSPTVIPSSRSSSFVVRTK